jgi:hypothetical protein
MAAVRRTGICRVPKTTSSQGYGGALTLVMRDRQRLGAQPPAAADAFQRPLLRRFRFQARLILIVSLHYAPHGQSTAPARTDSDTID